jgi:hypothetical protein
MLFALNSRNAVGRSINGTKFLGLKGAKRGFRFPNWQVTSDDRFLLELPRIFELFLGDS